MKQTVSIEAWRRDGERLWAAIQEKKLIVIPWRNPWRRLAMIGLGLLIVAIVVGVLMRSFLIAGALAAFSLPGFYYAVKFLRVGAQTGGLYSFFSERGFGIGCDADRLSIPYSSIVLPSIVSPSTVNQNYIILPVVGTSDGVRLERKSGIDSSWDGKPYTRGIASIVLQDGHIRARAYPNEMIVHLFCAIYPLSVFLNQREAAGGDTPPQPSATD
jgi:hypothetical protein